MGIMGHHLSVIEKENKVVKICQAYKEGKFTLESICQAEGNIGIRTFQNWCKADPKFQAMYQQARADSKNAFKSVLANKARESLLQRMTGYDHPETTTEMRYVPGVGDEARDVTKERHVKKTMKHYPASPDLIKFALINSDDENFKDKRVQEIALVPKKDAEPVESLPTDRLVAMETEMLQIRDKYVTEAKKGAPGDNEGGGSENPEQPES